MSVPGQYEGFLHLGIPGVIETCQRVMGGGVGTWF